MTDVGNKQMGHDVAYDQRGQHVETQYNVAGDLTINQAPQRTMPLQRPPRAEHFMGREQELAQLLTDLQPGRVVTLCGPGGIGKSALAAEAVWTLAPGDTPPDRFPDGIIFHSFASQPQAEVALETIARTFREEPKPTPAAAAQRALAGRRLLLLLDSTEDADDLPAVLAVRGGCGVLVTSRSRSDAQAERQDLAPLASAEAVKLLQAWGRGQASDEAAVKRISDFVGRLPLAVRLVGRYLEQTGETAAEYLEWLEETPIEALSPGEHREDNVTLLLEHSLAQVSDTARQVLAVAGLLALTSFDRAVIGAALELSGREMRRALNQLVSYGLLRREEDRFVVSHALIHTYARRRLTPSGETTGRLAAYYTALAKEQIALGPAGFSRLDVERAHLMRVLAQCIEQNKWQVAIDLVWAIEQDYLDMQGHWRERVIVLEAGLSAARELDDRYNEGTFLLRLGSTYRHLGQVDKGIEYLDQALTIARETGDRRSEGYLLSGLGLAYLALGQVDKGIEYLDQALTIARETGDRREEGNLLGNLGSTYHVLGQVDQALEYLDQALTIARETGDRRSEGDWIGDLGVVYFTLGQVGQALEYFDQALLIAREMGDRINEGTWLGTLGHTYRVRGQMDKAIEYYQQALTIIQEISGDPRREVPLLIGLGNARRRMERYDEALADFNRVIELNPDIDWAYYERELIHLVKNNPDLAQNDLSRAIDLARPKYEENPQNWRNTFNLALYTLVKGDTQTAKQLYQEAIDGQPPQHLIRKAGDDVADFLKLFPDHAQTQVMHELLQQHLE